MKETMMGNQNFKKIKLLKSILKLSFSMKLNYGNRNMIHTTLHK